MAFFTRDVDIDDTGSGLDGTIHDNAWLQSKYDTIENAFVSRSTITTTGSWGNLNATGVRWLYCNNATLLSISGLTPGVEGQRMFIVSIGAGQVDLVNQDTGAAAAYRLICGVTGTISLAAGLGRVALTYDATASRWRVIQHEQGGPIAFTASLLFGGAAVGMAYDVRLASYVLTGRSVRVVGQFTLTAKGSSTGFATLSGFPFTNEATYCARVSVFFYAALASVSYYVGGHILPSDSSAIIYTGGTGTITQLTEANFTDATNILFEVTYNAA